MTYLRAVKLTPTLDRPYLWPCERDFLIVDF
jgi:hypothetical protein